MDREDMLSTEGKNRNKIFVIEIAWYLRERHNTILTLGTVSPYSIVSSKFTKAYTCIGRKCFRDSVNCTFNH